MKMNLMSLHISKGVLINFHKQFYIVVSERLVFCLWSSVWHCVQIKLELWQHIVTRPANVLMKLKVVDVVRTAVFQNVATISMIDICSLQRSVSFDFPTNRNIQN